MLPQQSSLVFLLNMLLSFLVAAILKSGWSDALVSASHEECSWEDERTCGYQDPNLVPITVDLGDHQDTQLVYITPNVATFYNETPGTMKKKETSFSGQFGKFINMSPNTIRIYWFSNSKKKQYIADVNPFGAAGTATYPNHVFVVTPKDDSNVELHKWTIEKSNSLYKYDPYGSLEKAKTELTIDDFYLYKLQHENLAFSKAYYYKTGRQWLALYGRKKPPKFPMRPANALGEVHQVITNETHFVTQPPAIMVDTLLSPIPSTKDRSLISQLKPYRSEEETLTLNMTVISVAPRAFEIKNFLSNEEVTHILELATGIKLSRSTTRAGDAAKITTDDSTRTSENSWIARQRSGIIDSIYRRAAHLLQIDEACFRNRAENEHHLIENSTGPVTERLQLVHYAEGQQYTPHHDFAVPDLNYGQGSRFATLLLYLNEGMVGGETSFPRWLNGKTSDVLEVKPEVGKAVLFYNVLPDGNYDERSQHAAKPVKKGEKWLTNLWVWDPYQRRDF